MMIRIRDDAPSGSARQLDWKLEVRDEREAQARLEALRRALKDTPHPESRIDMEILRKRGRRR